MSEPIKFHTTTATAMLKLKKKENGHLKHLSDIIQCNLKALEAAIIFCANHAIGVFRINSSFMPLYTFSELKYEIDDLPDAALIHQGFQFCKQLAKTLLVRLTFHPDQFVVINSPTSKVVQSSLDELEYHGLIAELLGADVINIHAGGVYGDKKSALERFINEFPHLSKRVQKRLTIENDDKSYSPQDLLPICEKLGIPLVYDVHHHRCFKDSLSIQEASRLSYATWDREPLFHLSSPILGWSGKNPSRHHDYIDLADFPTCWFDLTPLSIEIEAKAKEMAIVKLQKDLKILGIK